MAVAAAVLPAGAAAVEAALSIPRLGFAGEAEHSAVAAGPQRTHALQGEMLQFYLVVPPAAQRSAPWLEGALRAREDGELSFDVEVRVRDPEAAPGQSALSHFHADSHSSPVEWRGGAGRVPFVARAANGDILVGAQTILSIPNAHDSPLLEVEVALMPRRRPRLEAEPLDDASSLRSFLDRQRVEATELLLPVFARRTLRVLQPLAVSSTDATCGSKVFISIAVENVHPTLDMVLEDLELHLNRTRYTLRGRKMELATAPLSRFFRVFFDREQLPLTLRPREVHSFVLAIEPLSCSAAELARVSDKLSSLYSLRWSCAETVFPVVLQQKAQWTRPPQDEVMVFLHHLSPVPLNRSFTVFVTVSNYGDQTFDFSIVILPHSHPLVVAGAAQRSDDAADAVSLVDLEEERRGDDAPTLEKADEKRPEAAPAAAQAGNAGGKQPPPLRVTVESSAALPTHEAETPGGADVLLAGLRAPIEQHSPTLLLCLETSVKLGEIPPRFSRSASLHFLALADGLLEIRNLCLLDERTGRLFALKETPSVFATHLLNE